MNLLHDSGCPEDPILVAPVVWLLCFPLAMGIEISRRIRLPKHATVRTALYTRTQTN